MLAEVAPKLSNYYSMLVQILISLWVWEFGKPDFAQSMAFMHQPLRYLCSSEALLCMRNMEAATSIYRKFKWIGQSFARQDSWYFWNEMLALRQYDIFLEL